MSSSLLPPADDRYFEDYAAGSIHEFGAIGLDKAELIDFARRYDPQPFHVDEEWAKKEGPFRGLIASGWQTASLAMRLYADHFLSTVASLASPGVDELRWVKPFRPGDSLSIRVEIISTRLSRTKPDRGLLNVQLQGFNQHGELVISFKAVNLIGVRPARRTA